MPKRLRNYSIYLAPQISGLIKANGIPEVLDEKNQVSLNPNDINDKITIYERQVNGWFLEPATRLLEGENNGFIVLMICISYIEGVQQYLHGRHSRGQSGTFFKQGLKRILALEVEDWKLDDFYSQVRCGLFHNGMSGEQVVISYGFPHAIDFSEPSTININPKKLLEIIRDDFKKYIDILKDDTNTHDRGKFNYMFHVQ